MTICGFNRTIGNGISLLVEGMVEAMKARERASGRSMLDLVQEEILDLDRIVASLEEAGAHGEFGMFRGLNLLARPFFELVHRQMRQGAEFESACYSVGNTFVELLELAEVTHDALRKGRSRDAALEMLGAWIVGRAQEGRSCGGSSVTQSDAQSKQS